MHQFQFEITPEGQSLVAPPLSEYNRKDEVLRCYPPDFFYSPLIYTRLFSPPRVLSKYG